jgi:hypothetical protein
VVVARSKRVINKRAKRGTVEGFFDGKGLKILRER